MDTIKEIIREFEEKYNLRIDVVTQYDDNGNEIYSKDSEGFERFWKRNDQGKPVYYKNSNGYEKFFEYDGRGNLIHHKNSDGDEEFFEYDSRGNMIHHKIVEGDDDPKDWGYACLTEFHKWFEYNDLNNEIHYKQQEVVNWYYEKGKVDHTSIFQYYERWTEYHANGEKSHFRDSDGVQKGWDEFGRRTYYVYKDRKIWMEYKDDKTIVHVVKDCKEIWLEYGKNTLSKHIKYSNGKEEWWEYDKNTDMISYRDTDEVTFCHEYFNKISPFKRPFESDIDLFLKEPKLLGSYTE